MNGSSTSRQYGSDSRPGVIGALRQGFEQLQEQRQPVDLGSDRLDVRAAVLGLLAEQPMNGHQIVRTLEERGGGERTPGAAAVYPVLQLLTDEGLATPTDSDGRKTYALTPAGRIAAEAARRRAARGDRRPRAAAPRRRPEGRGPARAGRGARGADRHPGPGRRRRRGARRGAPQGRLDPGAELTGVPQGGPRRGGPAGYDRRGRVRYRRILRFATRYMVENWWFELFLPRIGLGFVGIRGRTRRWRRMARNFYGLATELGGLMIKMGQFLSSRLDVLPPEVTRELEGLQDSVRPEDFADIRALAERELGMPLERAYASFDAAPLAAASLCLLYTSPSPRDATLSRMPSSA